MLPLTHTPSSPVWHAGKWPTSRPVMLTSSVPHQHTLPHNVRCTALRVCFTTNPGIQLSHLGAWGVEKGRKGAKRVRKELSYRTPFLCSRHHWRMELTGSLRLSAHPSDPSHPV